MSRITILPDVLWLLVATIPAIHASRRIAADMTSYSVDLPVLGNRRFSIGVFISVIRCFFFAFVLGLLLRQTACLSQCLGYYPLQLSVGRSEFIGCPLLYRAHRVGIYPENKAFSVCFFLCHLRFGLCLQRLLPHMGVLSASPLYI